MILAATEPVAKTVRRAPGAQPTVRTLSLSIASGILMLAGIFDAKYEISRRPGTLKPGLVFIGGSFMNRACYPELIARELDKKELSTEVRNLRLFRARAQIGLGRDLRLGRSADFWQRWHIMAIAGLWHGAGWNFRSTSFDCASTVLSRMLNLSALFADIRLMVSARDLSLISATAAIVLLMFAGRRLFRLYVRALRPLPLPFKVNVAVLVAVICFLLTARGVPPFQYFQF